MLIQSHQTGDGFREGCVLERQDLDVKMATEAVESKHMASITKFVLELYTFLHGRYLRNTSHRAGPLDV